MPETHGPPELEMRVLLLLASAALLAACEDHPNRQELVNTNVSLLDTREWLAKVQSQVGVMETVNVQPLAARVAALETENAALKEQLAKVQPPKQVYLVAKAGTPDEKVIGIGSPGSRCATSIEMAGVYCVNGQETFYFKGDKCDGDPFVAVGRWRDANLYRNVDSKVYRVLPVQIDVSVGSMRPNNQPGCSALSETLRSVHPLQEAGLIPDYGPDDSVTTELR